MAEPQSTARAFFDPSASGHRFLIDEAVRLPGLGHGIAALNQGIKLALLLIIHDAVGQRQPQSGAHLLRRGGR